jgi:hypothetical protein
VPLAHCKADRRAENLGLMPAGAAVGLGFALITAPAIRPLLYGISPLDPKSLATAILFVALTAALGNLFPFLSAIRTEHAETLRQEN